MHAGSSGPSQLPPRETQVTQPLNPDHASIFYCSADIIRPDGVSLPRIPRHLRHFVTKTYA